MKLSNFDLTSATTKQSFSEMNLKAEVLTALANMKITKPTEVQSLVIPMLLDKKEIAVVAETGSGKTLAYAVPMLNQLLVDPTSRAVVFVPTREVADQIFKVFSMLVKGLDISVAVVISGIPNKEQISQLKKNPRIIVATPGRLNEHLQNNKLLLQKVSMVGIDEADRMLDIGFVNQLENIRKTMRGAWQTMMFSASFNFSVEKVAQQFVSGEAFLVKTQNAEKPVSSLTQKVVHLQSGQKNDFLAKHLGSIKGRVIVFAGNQINCETVGEHLKQNGFKCDFMHGGLTAGHRNRVLRDFLEAKIQIMITTDLLARGLDVPDVECVVNYDLPSEAEDFLHRIGRTARAGKRGKALTFVTKLDQEMFKKIKPYISEAEQIHF